MDRARRRLEHLLRTLCPVYLIRWDLRGRRRSGLPLRSGITVPYFKHDPPRCHEERTGRGSVPRQRMTAIVVAIACAAGGHAGSSAYTPIRGSDDSSKLARVIIERRVIPAISRVWLLNRVAVSTFAYCNFQYELLQSY